VQLLPYIEESSIFKHIDFAVGAYDPKNAPARAICVSLFMCPSFGGPGRRPVADGGLGSKYFPSNYAACHHDVEAPIDVNNMGVMYLNSHIAQKEVTDGTSHTLYVGEKLADPQDLGWMSGTRATLRNTGTPINNRSSRDRRAMAGEPLPASNDLAVGGFESDHFGGCNMLFGDGRTTFVSESTELKVLQQLGNRADGQLLQHGPTRGD
jgi:hypothetical protein